MPRKKKKYVIKHIPSGKYLWEEYEIGFVLVDKIEDALLDDKSYVRYIVDDIEEICIEDGAKFYKAQETTKNDIEVYEVEVSVTIGNKLTF